VESSYSELTTLMTCPTKHHYLYDEGLAPEGEGSLSARFGHLWHKVMELHAKGVPDPVDAAAKLEQWQEPEKDHRTYGRMQLAYQLWKEQWAHQPYRYIKTEEKVGKGVIDAVVDCDSNQGYGVEEWLVDYKTTSQMMTAWVQLYRVSHQFKWYYAFGRTLAPKAVGVIVDIYHSTKGLTTEKGQQGKSEGEINGCRFHRLFLRYDDATIKESVNDFKAALLLRQYYREQKYWPKNTSACYNFGSTCPFIDICDTTDPELRERLKSVFPRKGADAPDRGPSSSETIRRLEESLGGGGERDGKDNPAENLP
jgi:hypothetical protein